MAAASLVRTLPPGPLDIIGDVHGDIGALQALLQHLGYGPQGEHPDGRLAVFLGDLTDRGPDSPAVVRLVRDLIESGRAQCVLGNHELNLMLGSRKVDNGWFIAEPFTDRAGNTVPQVFADEEMRRELLEFFAVLPLVLQRSDVRVVHACWQPEMVAIASRATNVLELFQQHRFSIELGLASRSDLTEAQKALRKQNLNPVKVLTSGLEVASKEPYSANGKTRITRRYPWWTDYTDEALCVFGHYGFPDGLSHATTGTFCADYGVARRWVNDDPSDRSATRWRLAALRLPERVVVFDDGQQRGLQDEMEG